MPFAGSLALFRRGRLPQTRFAWFAALALFPLASAAQADEAPRKLEATALSRLVGNTVFTPSVERTGSGQAQPLPAARYPLPASVLPLDRFLKQVEANYPKLIGADAERRSASAKRVEKQGAFDPALSFGTGQAIYNDDGKLKSSVVNEVGVDVLTPFGLKIGVGSRLNGGAVKAPFTTTGEGGEHYVSLKMPLLRGLGINDKSAAVRQAQLGETLADANFAQTRLELLAKAANDYWEWVAAGRRRKVAQELVELAKTRAEAIKLRTDAGDLPGIDAVEAAQEVKRREGLLIKADLDVVKAANKIAIYLWEDSGGALPAPTPAQIPPDDDAPPAPLKLEEAQTGLDRALKNRPEMQTIASSRDISRVDLRLARNQRLPALDLVLNPGIDTGVNSIGNTLKAGVYLTVPLRNRTADGRVDDAKLKIAKLDQAEREQRQRIVLEVDTAVQSVTAASDRHAAARQEYELAQRLETGERDRFAAGDSTLFLVNQRERATAEAASKVIDAYAEYQQALANYRAVTVQL